MSRCGEIKPITDKGVEIPSAWWNPHYTDERFIKTRDEGLSIFVDPFVTIVRSWGGDTGEDLAYDYSDRIAQFVGHEKLARIKDEVAEDGVNRRTARFIEFVLQKVFENDDLWLGHIKAGVNRSNGFSYQIYGYKKQAEG